MRNILESTHCEHLGYRLDPDGFGVVAVNNASEQEKEILARQTGGASQGKDLVLESASEANRDVFGIVTRIPNPYDNEGAVTIISSDHTRAVEQIAHTLTSEHRLSSVSAQSGWPAEAPTISRRGETEARSTRPSRAMS